jgi:hypothetical protein
MKNIVSSSLAAALFISSALSSAAAPSQDLTGAWRGTLDAGGVKLRVVFNITEAEDGGWTATMDSLDQGARGIPVDSIAVESSAMNIEVKAVQGKYSGTLDEAGTALKGQWTQGPNSLPLNLVKGPADNAAQATESTAEVLSPEDLEASKAAAQKIGGTWNGTLDAGGTSLRLRLNISTAGNGAATGTIDSLDQGANGIPLSAITLKEDKVRLEARGIFASYEGTLTANGTAIEGTWHQGGQTMPLDFQKPKSE